MSRIKRLCCFTVNSTINLGLLLAATTGFLFVTMNSVNNFNWFSILNQYPHFQELVDIIAVASYQLLYSFGPVPLLAFSIILLLWGIKGATGKQALSIPRIIAAGLAMFFILAAASYAKALPTWQAPSGLGGIYGVKVLAWFSAVGQSTRINAIPGSWLIWGLYSAIVMSLLVTFGVGTKKFYIFLCKFCYLPGYWIYLAHRCLFGANRLIFGKNKPAQPSEIAEENEATEATAGTVQPLRLFGSSRHIVVEKSAENEPEVASYRMPSLRLLQPHNLQKEKINNEELQAQAKKLTVVLREFGVFGEVVNVVYGPVVSQYEFQPVAGTKLPKLISSSEELGVALGLSSIRIVNIPEKNVVAIELPNSESKTSGARELFTQPEFTSGDSLKLAAGRTVTGDPLFFELNKLPHLLVSGAPGSGKSECINLMILSLLYRFSPNECKLILIDPKRLELSLYEDIPHLITPVITELKKAVLVLRWVVRQMELRHEKMIHLGVRNIQSYNERIAIAGKNKKSLFYQTNDGRKEVLTPLPYLVVVIDEVADLISVAKENVEAGIQRLVHMARAVGIHLIVATQNPSNEVITGTIKANFPARVCFKVGTAEESRTILGQKGAELLLGSGDLLFMKGTGRILRGQCATVADEEVEAVTNYLRNNYKVEYEYDFNAEESDAKKSKTGQSGRDNLYAEAMAFIADQDKCSISLIQRRFQIGYTRAARIVENLEENGVVSQPDSAGRRAVLIK